VVQQWRLPTIDAAPTGIALGPDGALWMTEEKGDRIARVTEAGAIKEFPLPRPGQPGLSITRGPDDALWFTDRGADEVDSMTTAGVLRRITMPAGSAPTGIAAGPESSLWVTESATGVVDRVSLDGIVTVAARLGADATPYGIAAGPDGNLWVTEAMAIARVTPAGAVTQFPLHEFGAGTLRIVSGTNAAMWFVEQTTSRVGYVTADGAVHHLPQILDQPTGIAKGPDGHMWVTEEGAGTVDRVDGEQVTKFTVAGGTSGPEDLVAGPGGSLWFTEFNAGEVASFAVSAVHS
jgi:virginiamycin B lyase